MRRRMWAGLTSVALACVGAWAQAPAQRPAFKTGVQLVRIDVSVVDDKRQPVRGLRVSDFTVLEDGQPRPVRAFEAVDHTATPAAATTSVETTTGVATNQASNDTSRLIFILMDRSIPPERPMIVARQIADAAVDAMAPGDQAAVITTGTGVPKNLTSDRARLHETIAGSDWSQAPSQAQQDQGAGKYDPLTDGACLCGLCVMDTIARIANAVRDVPRRKLLLFIGSDIIVQVGMTIGASTGLGCEKLVRDSREKLLDALQTSGLTVHSIDPQGVASVGPQTRASVPNGQPQLGPAERLEMMTQERMTFMKAQGNLAVLPDLTGGRTIVNSNEPFRMVPGVLHESDAYYLLAFEPIESAGDVRHSVEVKVARKGVQVHSARYIAPSTPTGDASGKAPSSPLERALTDLLPDASLPLGMSVSTFAGPDRDHAYVGITLDTSSFATAAGSVPLEIAVSASDERGRRVAAARQNGTVQVPPPGGKDVAAFVELQTYLMLPPGDYELRTAVMNSDTRAASSVFTHITVPAFDEHRLALSDVVLGTRENAGSLPEGAPSLPIVPTTGRVFNEGQPAWAFVRAYRAEEKGSTPPVSIETSVLDSSGKRVKHQSLPEASFAGRAADARLPLPLKGLPPGRYVLRIGARQGRAEASRSIAFAVAQPQPSLTQEHSPELDAALAAAAKYIDGYEHRVSAISAEEEYEQAAQRPTGGVVRGDLVGRGAIARDAPSATVTRKTRANIITISLGERGWVSFRDVFELDGHPVRDRIERLSRILQHIDPDSLEQARRIADESARYNLDPEGTRIDRTINVPMTALHFLRAANQPRSVFRLGKRERIAGVECVTLQFAEQGMPRLIRTSDNAPAQGAFWIDMTGGGRVVKTELRMQSAGAAGQSVRSQIAVTYARVNKLDVWVPVVMDETYYLAATGQVLNGHATYSDFREFKVITSEGIK